MHKKIGILLAGLMLLPGCLHVPSYKAKPLNTLRDDFAYHEIKNNIVVQAKVLSHGEIYYLFGDRTKELLGTTEIIHCSVHNLSNRNYVFSGKYIDFEPLSVRQVTRLIKTSSVARGVIGVAGVIGASIPTDEIVLTVLFSSAVPWGFVPASLFIWSGFAVVAAVTSSVFFGKAIKSGVMNGRIKKDLREKILDKDVVIRSGEKYEGLIFVKTADYKSQFSVMLHEKRNAKNAVTFDVNLQ